MPKKEQSEAMISETGNWNVADQYSKSKIMRPLNLCDYYEDIAFYGHESIVDQLIGYNVPPNDFIRVKALERLVRELVRLIDNSKFALKKPGSLKKVLQYKLVLKKMQAAIPNLVKVNRTSFKIINHQLFDDFLVKISDIKSRINEPLNQNHLIFTDRDEFDPKKFKDNLKRRMIQQG